MPLLNVIVWLEGSFEAEVVKAINDRSSMFTVTHRCADLLELEAAIQAGAGNVVVTDTAYPGVDANLIDRFHRAEVFILLTCVDALDHAGIGEDAWCDRDANAVVETLTSGLRRRMLGQTAMTETPVPALVAAEGRLVVVWGTGGAPGRSTMALNLARQLSGEDRIVTLVDGDIRGPAQMLMCALPVEASGLAAAVALRNRGELAQAALAELAQPLTGDLRLLSGLTRADRWRQLTGEAVREVLATCRAAGDVVVDISSGFTDEDPSLLSFVPSPEDINLTLAREADVLILVARADAVGLMRLHALVGDCREHGVQISAVVLNQARDGACGSSSRAALHSVMETIGGQFPYVIVERCEDVDEALLHACPVIDTNPTSDFVVSVDAVIEAAGLGRPQRGLKETNGIRRGLRKLTTWTANVGKTNAAVRGAGIATDRSPAQAQSGGRQIPAEGGEPTAGAHPGTTKAAGTQAIVTPVEPTGVAGKAQVEKIQAGEVKPGEDRAMEFPKRADRHKHKP